MATPPPGQPAHRHVGAGAAARVHLIAPAHTAMHELQLTPLGTSPAWFNPGEANAGFLLEAGGRRVLLDLGAGVLTRYLERSGAGARIDAVVLSHVHPDHCSDLVPLKYGIDHGTLGGWDVELWLPPGARERLTRLVSAWDEDFSFFERTFTVREYAPGAAFTAAGLACSAVQVPHFIESFALRVAAGSATLGYTGDLGPTDLIAPFMQGVDVLLSEATDPGDVDRGQPGRGHICAEEAGEIAHAAGAGGLLLTHVPEERGIADAVARARRAFGGPVEAARFGFTYDVGGFARSRDVPGARRSAAAG